MVSETNLEHKLALETGAKRTLAVEKLILSLTLTMCIPGVDVRDLTDTLEQVEDLMECFAALKLGSVTEGGKKKAKKENKGDDQRKKALAVLYDLLIA